MCANIDAGVSEEMARAGWLLSLAMGAALGCGRSPQTNEVRVRPSASARAPVALSVLSAESAQRVGPTPLSSTPSAAVSRAPTPLPLKLVAALPIERRDNFQPSGLMWHEGKLLTVSDKHETEVFELSIEATRVLVKSYRRFPLPAGVDELDLEGLCSDGAGGLLLASEAQVRVLRLAKDGTLSWFTPSLKALGARAGLFRLPNATLEGIARLDDGRIVLAAERSERGLIELPPDGDISRAQAWAMPESRFPLPGTRDPDFSDLTTFDSHLFGLVRSGHLIVRFERTDSGWHEADAWSFASVENDDRFSYIDRRYGVAEGLALDRNRIYLVLDNNGDGRTAYPAETRPQLFILERPAGKDG